MKMPIMGMTLIMKIPIMCSTLIMKVLIMRRKQTASRIITRTSIIIQTEMWRWS